MNERIREIAMSVQRDRHWDQEDIEKFGELIIQECAKQCNQVWYDTNNSYDPKMGAMNAETDPRMIGIKIGVKQGALKCVAQIEKHFSEDQKVAIPVSENWIEP